MILFLIVLIKIILSFLFISLLLALLFGVVFRCVIFVLDCFWEAAHSDFDDDFMWREDDYTFTGPFYFDAFYEQTYDINSWVVEFEDYFSDDEEDMDEDEDIEEEYFDKFYLDTLEQTWVWRNKFVTWLLRDPSTRHVKNYYDIRFFQKVNKK